MEEKLKFPDWAYLNKYKNENTLISAPPLGEQGIIFFGDSITEGWKKISPEFFIAKSYINRGINGQTTSQMLLRFRPDVIELKPKIVVILAGGNDIAGNTGPTTLETIIGNLISMCELAKANDIVVILCSILPANDFPWKRGMEPADKIEALNELILKYARANDIAYVDYFSVMVDERKGLKAIYSQDGVHPNKEGYRVMEPIVERIISNL
ncbi:SGNH/GDSL hydrolase family protein [Flavobacterium taihuense]|uniref:SGNH/GDSL hydrolase family protein n=1 Tax=Flavobacterium taihuense TaxID=2857508 RepID=A0ABS6XW44_9FLAO|nr:SGNH/GDSL hydrolase family protein [Flavobacterium taihuense]MBW4360139.1 SGNH/GDSL hydrolase family protein [Flavobacterium taihuense]